MKRAIAGIMILTISAIGWSCQSNKSFTEKEIALIPQVQKMTVGESSFKFGKSTQLVVENVEQEAIAGQLTQLFEKSAGWKPEIIVGGAEGSNQVFFKTDETLADEDYTLNVQKNRIDIKASRPAGFFYAMQTLRQLLPAELESSKQQQIDGSKPKVLKIYTSFKVILSNELRNS